jgi:hypothetical protein
VRRARDARPLHVAHACPQISGSVHEAHDVGAVIDTLRMVNGLATVVLTSTARGARCVALAATVESGAAGFDPFAAVPPGMPPGFMASPTHAEASRGRATAARRTRA